MRKIFLTIFSLALLSLVFISGSFVLAQGSSQEALDQLKAAGGASGANIAGSGPMDPRLIVAIIIRSALSLVGIVFLVLTLYAGFLWMTAGGEEEKISKAKKLLYNGVIGLAIILSAYAISYFVFQSLLGATTGSNPFGFGNGITNYGPNPADYDWYTGQ